MPTQLLIPPCINAATRYGCFMSPGRPILSQEEVVGIFETEFAPIREKFSVYDLSLSEARQNSESAINSPGVYVYWRQDLGVIKVGKSQSNS